MRICFPFFIFGKYGGVRVVTNIINMWVEKGNDVEVLTIGNNSPYFPISSKVNILRFKGKFELFKYLNKEFTRFDAIIGVYVISAYIVFLASLLHRSFRKSFYYIQAYEAEKEFSNRCGFWLHIAKMSYILPLHRVVNADIYKKYKNLKAKDIVYPGLDLEVYYPKNVAFFNEKIKIGCIGRTEEWKGTKDVCEAIEILANRGKDFEFYIAFNDFDTVEHHFVKPDGDQNLSMFYREMDIVVAPGHIQLGAIHYPVIESMAVGTSVITTGYVPADSTNSYIVGVKKPIQIADAIEAIIVDKDEAIRKREKALKDIQKFSWNNIASSFMRIISKGAK